MLFLAVHSVRIVAEGWRARQIARFGPLAWKAVYSLASLVGLIVIAKGYAQARLDPAIIWTPPVWTRHLAALLTVPAFLLLAAAYVPGNRIKAAVGHPMVLGVKMWALAHLIANGTFADTLLFGGFLVWAVFNYRAARKRDRQAGTTYPVTPGRDTAVVVGGLAVWALFAFWLHGALIGIAPFG
jgi:uncharacterized membrane protein